MATRKEPFLMRQFNGAGQCVDHCLWVCNPYELHVLMYDVRIIGCERFEVYSLAPNGGWDEPAIFYVP